MLCPVFIHPWKVEVGGEEDVGLVAGLADAPRVAHFVDERRARLGAQHLRHTEIVR